MNAINELSKSGAFANSERMAMPSQRVRATNTSPDQMHTIIDKEMTGHNLSPKGGTADFDMTEQDIERFQELNAKGHPVRIDVLSRRVAPEQQQAGGGQQTGGGASGASGGGQQTNAKK